MGFYKFIFPVLWFGVLGIVVISTLMKDSAEEIWFGIAIVIGMGILGILMMRRFTKGLVDSVDDHGAYLTVRCGEVSERIAFSNIMNIDSMMVMNPPRVTLRLIESGRLGDEIVFSPRVKRTFNPFAKSPLVESLVRRAHEARSKSTS